MSKSIHRIRKRVAATVAIGAFAATAGVMAPVTSGAATTVVTSRLAGADRYATAAAIATASFPAPAGAVNVVIASGTSFPDGLSAAALAGKLGGPILLTEAAALPAITKSTITSLGAKNIYLIGGEAAISAAVATELSTMTGVTVTRISGATRYGTAAAVAGMVGSSSVGIFNGKKTVLIATGENFPDALAASAPAYSGIHPILLTTPSALSPETGPAITALGATQAIILGGTSAVSQATEDAIKALGLTTVRVSGADRYETASKLADILVTPAPAGFGYDGRDVALASGTSFPDALAGGAWAGKNSAPIILTDVALPAASRAWLAAHATTVDRIVAFGGVAAVTDAALNDAKVAATSTVTNLTAAPELVSAAITSAAQGIVTFTFDQEVTGSILDQAGVAGTGEFQDLRLYTALGQAIDAFDARIEGNLVIADFDAVNAGVIAGATTAAVTQGAVTNTLGLPNPAGSTPLQAVSNPGAITAGPDLVSVGNFSTTGAGQVADFVFDEAVDPLSLVGTGASFVLVGQNGNIYTGVVDGFLSLADATNKTVTVLYDTTPPLTAVPFGEVVRGVVLAGAVDDGAIPNVLHAADVAQSGNTVDPDLISVTKVNATTVSFNFDEAVADDLLVDANIVDISFALYDATGTATQAAAGTANRSLVDTKAVLVTFAAGVVANAVGGNVLASAVIATDNTATNNGGLNRPDEAPVAFSAAAGITALPDLVAVTRSQDPVTLNWTVVFTFDQSVAGVAFAAGDFAIWDSNGANFNPAGAPVVPGATPNSAVFSPALGNGFLNDRVETSTLGAVSDVSAIDAPPAAPLFPEGDARI